MCEGSYRCRRTSRFISKTLGDLALGLEIDVPAVGLAGLVLEGEGEDGVALLDGVLTLGVGGGEGCVDGIEGLGGGE